MKVLEAEFVRGFIRMANDGWEQGWHERNGGNLSYRIKPEEVDSVKENFELEEWQLIGTSVPKLAGEYFLVTGSGKYFRNVIIKPEDSIGIIEIDEQGENYRICWGLVNGGRPTSELPSHLMNHEVKKLASDGKHRVIYHAHTTNVIALTFVLPLDDKVFTRELWEMATECPVVFPDGIGVVPWMVPGGREIAVATSELMKKYDVVIWAHHGMFASGEDFDLTFGLMHTVEKSAEILVKTLSMRPDKRQTISPQNFRDLAEDFKVQLSEKFLYKNMAAKTSNFYARIEPEVKEEAESILAALGISASNAINMFYKQIILNRGIPFEVKIPPVRPVNVAEISETELEKGYADMKAGKTKSAKQAFADIRRDYRI